MNKSTRCIFVLAVGVSLLHVRDASAAASAQGLAPAVTSLVESERSFARMASDKGIRDAFLAYLAEDSIIFRPGPVPGRKWYQDRPASAGVLLWEPAFADLSGSGDMGYTTGPWSFKNGPADAEPVAFGHFVSVWRKQADGSWKVVLDTGSSHPKPKVDTAGVTSGPLAQAPRGKDAATVDAAKAQEDLTGTDRAFSAASKTGGLADAYKAFAADDIRYYPHNGMPLLGREATLALLSTRVGVMTWEPAAAHVSASGDLGYTYGAAHWNGANSETHPSDPTDFTYTTIWRRAGDDKWKAALSIAVPMPPVKP